MTAPLTAARAISEAIRFASQPSPTKFRAYAPIVVRGRRAIFLHPMDKSRVTSRIRFTDTADREDRLTVLTSECTPLVEACAALAAQALEEFGDPDDICTDGQCELPRGSCRSCQAEAAEDMRRGDFE